MYYLILIFIILILTITTYILHRKYNRIIIDKDIQIEILSSEVNKLTVKDPLTNTYNRQFFDENYTKEFHRARRVKQPLALIYFDVDNIDEIQKDHGKEAVDITLKELSLILNDVIQRDTDFVARYNSHLFATVLYNTFSDGVELVTERILTKIKNIKLYDQNISLSIGVHVGIPDNHTNTEMMINESLKALTKAKKRENNSIEFSLNSI